MDWAIEFTYLDVESIARIPILRRLHIQIVSYHHLTYRTLMIG